MGPAPAVPWQARPRLLYTDLMRISIDPRRFAALVVVLGLAIAGPSVGAAGGPDSLDRPEGKRLAGTFGGDLARGFRFTPTDGSAPIAIDGPADIALGGDGPGPSAGVPPLQVVLGHNQWVSGQLVRLDAATVRLGDGPGGRPVTVDRRGAIGLRQRPGEALVLIEGFEAIDPARWSHVGEPKLDPALKAGGESSLRIDADGTAITARLAEPVAQGRLELAFYDTAAVVPSAQWFVDLLFRGEGGPETIRAVLGWAEESLAVQSTGGGPSLVVQRLARKPGWHRLEVRFGPEAAEMAVDGDALAHGKGPTGPLVEIRIATSLSGDGPPAARPVAHVDELRVVRLTDAVGGSEADPDQDEARLVEGDQVFGAILGADPQRVSLDVLGKTVALPWSVVTSLHFRRESRPSREVEGLLARLEWRSAPGDDARDLDMAEGALISAGPESFTLETPYAGTLVIPRDRLRRARVAGRGRTIVIDPTAHHLGDEVSKAPELLDPPQPEGSVLERSFTLARAPAAGESASLALDVVQVVGEANGLMFSQLIRLGELRTKVSLNGREFDYLNRHITTRNETPERIRLPIPTGLLKAGENRVRIVQYGRESDPNYLDDLGILGIAVEIRATTEQP